MIGVDLYSNNLRYVRDGLALVITPLQWIVDVPNRIADEISNVVVDRGLLLKENARLKSDALLLEQKVLKIKSMEQDNKELRRLLVGRQLLKEEVKLVELIGVTPNPFEHQVVINHGSEDGVFEGQSVLDFGGVMGQVVQPSLYTSRVMLITDARHAIPVEFNRTGFRSIALGKGVLDELELEHVPDTVDIRVGDLLVTSGLGGRFPRGYPVAEIFEVERDPGKPFARVRAHPTARLDRSRFLLLVEQEKAFPNPSSAPELSTPNE